ncbi:MAG: hypothetical protein ACRCSN_08455 [Dermatophilaceae bacterium]
MADAPENLDDLHRDLKRALRIMDERRGSYIKGREYYDGTRSEVAASKHVRKIIKENAEFYPISLAHIPVDVVVDMLELTALTVDGAGSDALELIAERNDIDDSAEDWTRKAAYFGDYYVIVDPAEEDDRGVVVESVRWVGSSPLSTVVVYDEADERTPLYGAKVWRKANAWHARLFYADCTVQLVANSSGLEAKAQAFELDFVDEVEDAFVTHDGGRPLVVHLAIDGRPYGTPLHRKAWGAQDAITKISASNLANIEAVALPSRWALLDPAAEIDDDIDDDFGTDAPGTSASKADAQTTATAGSKLRTGAGAMAFLRGIKQVGTFENGDGNVFLTNLDWYVRAMAVASGVPLFEFDLGGEQPSGESRRRAMARALKKAKRVRRAAGGFLESIAELTLAVLGQGGQTATATYYPIETSTDTEGIELVAAKIKAGVPVRDALLEAGYTVDQVDGWWPEGAPAVTMDMLAILGAALAQLGTAKTLGVVTDEELRDMLPTLLTGARGETIAPEVDTLPPEVQADASVAGDLRLQAEALGQLIRAGADPEQAAAKVGLEGLEFPNVPVTVRIPESEATALEGSAPTPPLAV